MKPVLTALKNQVYTLINNRYQPKVRGSDSVESSTPCHKLSPNPSCALWGLHVASLSIFCNHIMIELAATEFTICYVERLKGWEGSRIRQAQLTDSTPELIEL